ARQLEAYWKMYPPDGQNRDGLLSQAVENYRLASDTAPELRVLSQLDQRGELSGELITRYAELVSKTPQRFLTITKSDKSVSVRNDFAGYALDNFNPARALEVIAARGVGQPPVWNRVYTGLAGLYFASPAPQ